MDSSTSPMVGAAMALWLLMGAIALPPLLFPAAAIAQSPQERQAEARRLYNQGMQQYQAEQLSEALQSFLDALAIYQELGLTDSEGVLLYNIALIYETLNQPEEALQYYLQSLDLSTETEDPRATGTTLNAIGVLYGNLGRYNEAIEYYQRALVLRRETGDRPGERVTLTNLGAAYVQLGRYSEGLDFYQQALAIPINPGEDAHEGDTFYNIGLAYYNVRDYEQALAFYQRALVARRELGDRRGEAAILQSMGVLYGSLGQYEQAWPYYQQALAIQTDLQDGLGAIQTLTNIGLAYNSQGDYNQAIAHFQQARELAASLNNSVAFSRATNSIGLTYYNQGYYSEALDIFQEALTLSRQAGDRQQESLALNNIGQVYVELGQPDQALTYYQQSLDIATEQQDQATVGIVLNNLGRVYEYMQQYPKAIQYYQESANISTTIGDYSGASVVLNNVGEIYRRLHAYDQALTYYRQALTLQTDIGDRPGQGTTLNNLGSVYANLQQYDQAQDYYQQALVIRTGLGDRRGQSITLSNLGYLFADQGKPELAILFLKQAINSWEAIREGLTPLPLEQQQSFVNTLADVYRRLADLLLQQDRVLEAQQVLDLLKVQELNDYLNSDRGSTPEVTVLRSESDILEQYNQLQQSAIALGQERAQIETRMRQQGQRSEADQQRLDQIAQLQTALKADFISFSQRPDIQALLTQLNRTASNQTVPLEGLDGLRGNLGELHAVLLYPLILDDRLELIITTPDSPPLRRTVTGVSRTELNAAILAFREALASPTADAVTPARQLYQWLMAPLEDDLAQVAATLPPDTPITIIYAPDSQLRYVPLAALHDGTHWMAERFRINQITAVSLRTLNPQLPFHPRIMAGAFANANQNYIIQIGQRSLNFRGLPYARVEVEALDTLVPNTDVYLDQDFDLESLQPLMNVYNVLHFATHAAFVPGEPKASFILFGDGSTATLADIANWSLTNVELVVLSACETGLGGYDNNGEQILGLGYQFQSIGVRATIASLWQVNDQATQILMDNFYQALNNGTSIAEALRRAQVALITGDDSILSSRGGIEVEPIASGTPLTVSTTTGVAPFSHPHYWAPFILIGNGL